ncbi:sigma-70 family RNA polymerase sigma factor [Flavihumibacter petaseus]|uniref:Putative RNA polymerase ECF-type sigma factor n=1 Tax=Flavihumibacter petaseus NBRC 106054 TaxID=1220578 RepID=A0A0E9MYS4_9BACT|nr:sigma-70 family RNA polymerase sigma factor [Flavihumibacter petaseus]GAO42759.1 putative RNA polymerase ECF-type sigma factor [Flavihumibacter petaseus NBRC 106054]
MEILNNYQGRLFPYAYNILGSAADAMDAVQDVMMKYVAVPRSEMENETGYLVKGVINQSINIRKRNRRSVGDAVWLPEPIATENADQAINRNEIISYSMMVLLEYLDPKERAVFILKEAFDYSHEEIAAILSLSVENSRKVLSRAKRTLKGRRENFKPAAGSTEVLQRYIETIRNGDTEALEKILAKDIAVKTDGGAIKIVAPVVTGQQAVIDLLSYVYKTYHHSLSVKVRLVNHQPALLFFKEDLLVNCQVFDIEDDSVKGIYSIVDPEKLKDRWHLYCMSLLGP